MTMREDLHNKITTRTARVGVIGLGYVGLPLAIELAKAGFRVTGIEQNQGRVDRVNQGKSYIADVSPQLLQDMVQTRRLLATSDFSVARDLDVLVICVPTPLTTSREPDISHIRDAVARIARTLRPGQLICLESTTYPGTVQEVVLPALSASGLKVGVDFFLVFSGERIDPGNREFTVRNIPKVVGGVTPACTEMAATFYSQVIDRVVPVSSPKAAEMTKLLENVFRFVNIALVNEFALICEEMGISIWEVVEAARTKPFGMMNFVPGPGVGGHCIAVDPYYLLWRTNSFNSRARFVELASDINDSMADFVTRKVVTAIGRGEDGLRGARVLILGMAYKRDSDDWRQSPALAIVELLRAQGAEVSYHDPFIPEIVDNNSHQAMRSVTLTAEILAAADCVVIVTDHRSYDFDWIVAQARAVVDTRNATRDVSVGREKITLL